MATPVSGDAPLYVRIAESLTQQVARGALRTGDRVPSLRQLSRQRGVSISTALQAYLLLEDRGYLEARPQSGFYVRAPYATLIPEPQFEAAKTQPTSLGINAILAGMMESANDPANIPFAAGSASPELFPTRRLNLILRRIVRRDPFHSIRYDFPPGAEPLRRQIARRSMDAGGGFSPRDVIVTCGAQEGINLGLRAVTQPGDVIAVESPTYFGILESAASMKLKVVEISTHPQQGMDLDELERAIRKHRIKACVVMTNCHNPLGYVLSDSYKKALVDVTARHHVAIIEDDVYGDLSFEGARPRTLKSYDQKGLVILCSSFSKVISPGYRVGWMVAGRFRSEVERLKFLTTVASPSLFQMVVAEFLSSGGYDRHLKRMRNTMAGYVEVMRQAIAKYFPAGTRISRPAGGHMLWIELPPKINSLKLYQAALAERVCVLPGTIFSATGRYKNYLRVNCAHTFSDVHDRALLTLGKLCEKTG